MLIAREGYSTWKDAFKTCDGNFGGSEVFQHCQPQFCDASKAKDQIYNIGLGNQQYWINGYVLRSPLLTQKGRCIDQQLPFLK